MRNGETFITRYPVCRMRGEYVVYEERWEYYLITRYPVCRMRGEYVVYKKGEG
jgi:hypothetical protein